MPEFLIDSPLDPRLDPYRDLKRSASLPSTMFIAEGEKLVRRLLESPCRAQSILCNAAGRQRLVDELPAALPIYITSTAVISGLVGFQFHRGLLACGARPPETSLETLLQAMTKQKRVLLVLCPEIRDPENLGTIIRTAAAFGAAGIVVGRSGTDPYSRRVLRTSMGSVLQLPLVQTDDWHSVLASLHEHEVETVAAVLDPCAESLVSARCSTGPMALLFGNESAGLPADLIRLCRRRVTLPMAQGVDSLNVAVAAGIVLHHFAQHHFETGTPGTP
ncbi:MAG: RNA methyltransferase [Planctomycetaceae bacterium]|nr:RNA methyltransferase [Planctomycetaceae bacterium]